MKINKDVLFNKINKRYRCLNIPETNYQKANQDYSNVYYWSLSVFFETDFSFPVFSGTGILFHSKISYFERGRR